MYACGIQILVHVEKSNVMLSTNVRKSWADGIHIWIRESWQD